MSASRYVQPNCHKSSFCTIHHLIWFLVVFANFLHSVHSSIYLQHSQQQQQSSNPNLLQISSELADYSQQTKLSDLQVVQTFIKALHDLNLLEKSQEGQDLSGQQQREFPEQQSDQGGQHKAIAQYVGHKPIGDVIGGLAQLGSEIVEDDEPAGSLNDDKRPCWPISGSCSVDVPTITKTECYQKAAAIGLLKAKFVCDATLDQIHSVKSSDPEIVDESKRSRLTPEVRVDEILSSLSSANRVDSTRVIPARSDGDAEKGLEYTKLENSRSHTFDCNQKACPPEEVDQTLTADAWPREIERRLSPGTGPSLSLLGSRGFQLTNSDSLMRKLLERQQRQQIPIMLVRLGELRNQRRSVDYKQIGSGRLVTTRLHHRSDTNLTSSPTPGDFSGLPESVNLDALATAANRTLTAMGLMLGADQGTMGMMSNQLVERHHQSADSPVGSADTSITKDAATPSGMVSSDSPLDCNMRRFTYRASKSDSQGNRCFGLVTATICYGGCDTGEYADWVFPYKKSIHRVCTHGGRARRHALLTDCQSSSGEPLVADLADMNLRRYTYVDATHCVCERCKSADTTCVGSLTRPYLPSIASDPVNGLPTGSGLQQQPAAPTLVY